MIAHNFIYCRPQQADEAVEAYAHYAAQGKNVYYYSGGSEIITMATAGSIRPEVVIDIKALAIAQVLEEDGPWLRLGAALTLEAIRRSGCFPLLGHSVRRIADHSNQCRITLGGNLCGSIRYREAVLPLLLAEAQALLLDRQGQRQVALAEIFDGRLRLRQGELLLQILLPKQLAALPYAHIKKTMSEKIGYPALTAVCLYTQAQPRWAFSGLCQNPFRSREIEQALAREDCRIAERIEQALQLLPTPAVTDSEGSSAYRKLLFRTVVAEILEGAEEGKHANL